MEAFGGGGGRYSSYSFLTLVVDRGEWSASHPGCGLRIRSHKYHLQEQFVPILSLYAELGWPPQLLIKTQMKTFQEQIKGQNRASFIRYTKVSVYN
jgi:hypothetical protein